MRQLPDPLSNLPMALLALALAACGGETAAVDGGADAGVSAQDGGVAEDAGAADAGTPDTGAAEDSGTEDAGAEDAGPGPLSCAGATLRTLSTDTATTGPWAVGVRTATVAGLVTEVWYPAPPESADGVATAVYDIREHLPASERGKIPDADNPWQQSAGRRGLPLDTAYGPYPVVIFVHGTASFRTQSVAQATHWASRGFVVVAADHPGLMLRDLLSTACGAGFTQQNLPRDLNSLIDALAAPAGDLAFLADHIDLGRLGMVGHSAGGTAILGQGSRAAVLIPLAAGAPSGGAELRLSLVMAAQDDQVVAYGRSRDAYEAAPGPKRFVGLADTGHLAFANLCSLRNAEGQDLVAIGAEHGVCGVALAGQLFDCSEAYIPDQRAWTVIDDATSAALESVLQCRPEAIAGLEGLADRYPAEVAEVLASP